MYSIQENTSLWSLRGIITIKGGNRVFVLEEQHLEHSSLAAHLSPVKHPPSDAERTRLWAALVVKQTH